MGCILLSRTKLGRTPRGYRLRLNERGNLSHTAIAEGVTNNVRQTISLRQFIDPRFYEVMSKLLDDLIRQYRTENLAYEEFLRQIKALVEQLVAIQPGDELPVALRDNPEATVIYNNLPDILALGDQENARIDLAIGIDNSMRRHAPANWRGDQAREAQVMNALYELLERNGEAARAMFELVRNQPAY